MPYVSMGLNPGLYPHLQPFSVFRAMILGLTLHKASQNPCSWGQKGAAKWGKKDWALVRYNEVKRKISKVSSSNQGSREVVRRKMRTTATFFKLGPRPTLNKEWCLSGLAGLKLKSLALITFSDVDMVLSLYFCEVSELLWLQPNIHNQDNWT